MVLEYTFCCGNGNLLFLRTVDNFRFSKSHSHGFGIHLLLRQRKSPFSSHGGQFSFFKITQPSFWNTPSVAATEISFFFARWTIFVFLIGTVTAIIFAIAKQPLGNASVIGMTGTSTPSRCAVFVSTNMSRLIAVISAIVVKIASP